jgi:hypothetical protein
MLIRTSRDAEQAACRWMQSVGFHDARLTPLGRDGGVDIVATGAIAQVKAEAKPVGAPVVQQTAGIAAVRKTQGFVFALAGYTNDAKMFANRAAIALYTFDLQGDIVAVNDTARATSIAGARIAEHIRLEEVARSIGIDGITSIAAPPPAAGMRASNQRLAAWIAQYAAKVQQLTADDPPVSFSVDLGGSPYGLCRLTLGSRTYDMPPEVYVSINGQVIDQTGPVDVLSNGSALIPAHDVGTLIRFAVGLTVDVLRRAGASIDNLRVITPIADPYGRPDPTLEHLVERLDPDPHLQLVDTVRRHRTTVLELKDAVRWRQLRIDLTRNGRRVTVQPVAEQYADYRTPGPDTIKAALQRELTGIRIIKPRTALGSVFTDPNYDRKANTIVKFTVDIDQLATSLAVLTEAFTLNPDDWRPAD